jgi:tRNA1Val (adenine37-N6)-methyltransferase
MANNFFLFKQFTIFHDKCAMKVGTDGVLLGAWVNAGIAGRILDVGTGTGLIAIMMAQRCSAAVIDAVEIDEKASLQAGENVAACPWRERIMVVHDSFQHFAQNAVARYDVVVCNPPFFRNALRSPIALRSVARHDTNLSYESLLFYTAKILANEGRLAVIIPAFELIRLTEQAFLQGLFVSKILRIKPLPEKPDTRCLVELLQDRYAQCAESSLTIRNNDLITYTVEYKSLTGDFYL